MELYNSGMGVGPMFSPGAVEWLIHMYALLIKGERCGGGAKLVNMWGLMVVALYSYNMNVCQRCIVGKSGSIKCSMCSSAVCTFMPVEVKAHIDPFLNKYYIYFQILEYLCIHLQADWILHIEPKESRVVVWQTLHLHRRLTGDWSGTLEAGMIDLQATKMRGQ